MPYVLRRPFNVLAVVSLVLCIASAGLWVRSYWYADGIARVDAASTLNATSNRGELVIRRDTYNNVFVGGGKQGWITGHWHATNTPRAPVGAGERWDYHLLGFAWRARGDGASPPGVRAGTFWWPYWEVVVPDAAVVALLAIATALAIRGWRNDRRNHRRASGQCVRCGYDLRATPDRCPECGMAAAAGAG
jgi:hypothetical protein